MEFLLLPLALFVARPLLALLPAAIFLGCFVACRARPGAGRERAMLLGVAATWAAYAGYEAGVQRWSRTVVAPIRVDLFVIGPILYATVLLGLRACVRAHRKGPIA